MWLELLCLLWGFKSSPFLQNEEILKKTTSDYQEKLKRSEEKYRMLKKHAEEKIERFVFNEFLNDERTISFYYESVWSNNPNQNTGIFLFWNKNSEIALQFK